MSNPYVTIIIPAFNAEMSLVKTLNSILDQTNKDFEVIVVDDCSTDETHKTLTFYQKKFISSGIGFKILTHELNMGVATARNTGLVNAIGDYIYFIDSDDCIENTTLENFILKSSSGKIDIVGCNWYLKVKHKTRIMYQPQISSTSDCINLMFKGVLKWNLWLYFIKRELFDRNKLRFIDNLNMGEDMLMMFKLFLVAKSITFTQKALYYYDKSNDSSLTNQYSIRHKNEVALNLFELESIFLKYTKQQNEIELLNFLKLNIKLPLLITDKIGNYKEWINWYPESNSYVFKNDQLSFRIKFVQYMAFKRQFWFVKFHYFLLKCLNFMLYK